MRFEPQVPNTMSLKVRKGRGRCGKPYRSGRTNLLCMKEVFLLTKWELARPSSPEFSLGKQEVELMESANMVTCYFSSKEWTKVVIVNQAFVQRNHQQFKLIHLAVMERKFSRSRKFILSRRRKGDQVGQKPWSNLRSYAYSMPGLARRQNNKCTKRRIDRDLLDPVQQTGSLLLEKKSSIGQVPR